VAQVKAVACELMTELGIPISRFSRAELHRLVIERGVTDASASTIAVAGHGGAQALAAPLVGISMRPEVPRAR
jgi:hypothetical protein